MYQGVQVKVHTTQQKLQALRNLRLLIMRYFNEFE